MKKMNQLLFALLITGLLFSCQSTKKNKQGVETTTEPTIVTQENFPVAFTNMRFGAVLKKTGGVNKFFEMPVPPSEPEKQFVVRMNRDTYYSFAIVDMTSDSVFINIPTEAGKYVSAQVIDENHETQPMFYGTGRHKITAKTPHAFVIVRALEDHVRRNLIVEAGSAKPFEVKEWDMESFKKLEAAGELDFSDGYDQSKAFGSPETGQTPYFNYVGCSGGWGGAMVVDNIYQSSKSYDNEGCYEMTFVNPEDIHFWSATVYNADGRMFNDIANISSEMDPVINADGTITMRFGCDGEANNIPIREGNTTGKFNVTMRHYGPSTMVSNGEEGYNSIATLKKIQ